MTDNMHAIPRITDIALMHAWSRFGVWFTVTPSNAPLDLELTIAQTAVVAPSNERLFVMAATWLSARHMIVDARRLVFAVQQLDARASAVAGAMLSLAATATTGQTALNAAILHCRPLRRPAPLFDVVRKFPKLLPLLNRETPDMYRRWGLWHNDTRLAFDALRPVRWTLRHCPELRLRALLGTGLDARVAMVLVEHPATIAELAAAPARRTRQRTPQQAALPGAGCSNRLRQTPALNGGRSHGPWSAPPESRSPLARLSCGTANKRTHVIR